MSFHLSRLHLLNYRNHREVALDLSPGVNCFTGPNGTGKTNLLDAVHGLALGKGFLEPADSHSILHGEDLFVVQGTLVVPDGEDHVLCSVRRGQRKVISRNRKEYDRLAGHVGRYPVVVIAPHDAHLVTDGSEARRRFLDGLIAQFDAAYLDDLLRYNRALAQRNTLLKRMAPQGGPPAAMLEPWDEQLVLHGTAVHAGRTAFMAELTPLLEEHYRGISPGPERVALAYRSSLHGTPLRASLAAALDRDRALQHTTVGVHKDDLEFTIDGRPLKRFGSQGQQKTYLIALKLAQFDLTHRRNGMRPILLLDDIFDKLDPQRMRHLLALFAGHRFGQVLITDTDAQRLHRALDGLGLQTRFFHLAHHAPIRHEEEKQRTVAG